MEDQEVLSGTETCPCGCDGNILHCVYSSTFSPEKISWLESVDDVIHASFNGCYLDLESMSGQFIKKILRLCDKAFAPKKAAKIILRYVSFTNYLHAKMA